MFINKSIVGDRKMADIAFKRTGKINSNGSVPGELTVGTRTWPTIERGATYTFVRKGEYELLMCYKVSGRHIPCLCFHESRAISTHLIHDALNDDHNELEGCIAPGTSADDKGINGSAKAMQEVFAALGGFAEWRKVTIDVQNNVAGLETKDEWIKRREAARKND
jgi:hypothetical protein